MKTAVKNDYYMTLTLSDGKVAGVIEGLGLHLFFAMMESKGCSTSMLKFLVLEIVFIENKKMTESELDNMPIKDVNKLISVVSNMLEDKNLI